MSRRPRSCPARPTITSRSRRRRVDLFRQFFTGGEARDLVEGSGGFQGIDAFVQHADFHQELGGGDLVLFLYLLQAVLDRKSTRLNSSHLGISYAVFCLKKKKH